MHTRNNGTLRGTEFGRETSISQNTAVTETLLQCIRNVFEKKGNGKRNVQQTQPCRVLVFLFFSFRSEQHGDPQTLTQIHTGTEKKKREKERHKSVRSVRTDARSETNVHGSRTYDSIAPLISTLN